MGKRKLLFFKFRAEAKSAPKGTTGVVSFDLAAENPRFCLVLYIFAAGSYKQHLIAVQSVDNHHFA